MNSKRVTVSLSQQELGTLLFAIESAMSKILEGSDTSETQHQLKRLDTLWSVMMSAGSEEITGGPPSLEVSAYLNLMQCSEV